jgi:hypothetical protein
MKIRLKFFLAHNWENPQDEKNLRVQVLAASLSSMPLAQHDPPIHKCLFRNLVFEHVGEYFQVTHILAPFFLAPTSFDTTWLAPFYILNQMVSFHFFWKIMN